MNVADFDFDLPDSLIAERPMEPREAARLLCVGDAALEAASECSFTTRKLRFLGGFRLASP